MSVVDDLVILLADLDAHIEDVRAALVELGVDAEGAPTSALGDLVRSLAAATAPVNVSPPVVTGSPFAGELLTTTFGTWSGTIPITYAIQWYRNGVAIVGADETTHQTADPADIDADFFARITATNSVGFATDDSNEITTAEFTDVATDWDSDQVTFDTDALTFDHEAP